MTDRGTQPGPRAAQTRAQPGWTITGAIGLFLALLVLLALQMRAGRDPSLGVARRTPVVVAQAPVRRVLVKRIVRRVIDTVVVEEPAVVVAGTSASPTPVTSSAPTVVQYASAPVVQPAPAPAPAPAPIVTRSS